LQTDHAEVREIYVLDIEFWGRHGIFDEERAEGRRFQVDVRALVDTWPDDDVDHLDETVDYRQLAQAVVDVGQGESVRLVETLASRICDRCLALPSVIRVEVCVRKRATGVPGTPTWVGARLVRDAEAAPPRPGHATLAQLEAEGVPVLDTEVVAELRELQIEGEEDVVAQLVRAYLQDLPERLGTIQTAVQNGDASAIEMAAHALKAASGSIGALQVARICRLLEHAGAEGALDDTPALLDAFEVACDQACSLLRPLAPNG